MKAQQTNRRFHILAIAIISVAFVTLPCLAQAAPDPLTRLYDTITPSPSPLPPADIATQTGWFLVPEDGLDHAFKGDTVIRNDRVAIVVRKHGIGAEVYSLEPGGAALRAILTVPDTDAAKQLQQLKITGNAQDNVSVEAEYTGAKHTPQGMRLELSIGQPFVKVLPVGSARALIVRAPCQYLVVPDFFADDIVVSAADIPNQSAELPSENFVMHLCDDGNAIVMNVWDKRSQDVRLKIDEADQTINSTEIEFGEGGAVWVAILSRPGMWHSRSVTRQDRDKILSLDWKRPFPAVWRVDWRSANSLTDSWEMAVEKPDGRFRKSDLFEVSRDDWTDEDWWFDKKPRWRWNTGGIGGYPYPCWFDKQGNAFLQPLKKGAEFDGPAVIYPINRDSETPLSDFTVTDIVRSTLGVGPCQYILDIEGQGLAFKGQPTCTVRDLLDPIYENGEQTARKAEVTQSLDDVLAFMRLIRGRIEEYRAFGKQMQTYLTAQRGKNPDIDPFIDSMLVLISEIDASVERRKEGMNTPEHATALVQEFRDTLVGYTGPDAFDRCQKLTSGFVKIGDNQDELVAECRRVVKVMRQRAAIELARDGRVAPVVDDIRARTQAILRDPVNYEAARH